MTCLLPEQVELLARGELDKAEADALRQHVEQCEHCRRNLDEWLSNEEALRELRRLSGSALLRQAAGLLPRDAFPGYEVICEIHRGGQGVVYEAVQLATQRTVAVKVLLEGPFADERARWRFEREVKLIATLRHPNIIVIHDSGILHGKYYFAMDYVRGRPLDAHVRVAGLAVREIVALFRQVCDAVAYAHRRGVIHRDLKPSNILVSETGEPCVLDFGLAKSIGDDVKESQARQVSMPGRLMGTLRYMSPEQTLPDLDSIDTRTDVYTLGVILYELLTGSPPYDTNVDLAVALTNIREVDPPRPSRQRKEVHSELDAVVLKAMAKEPDRRYQSAGELAEDLAAWLDGRPVAAKSASSFYVVRKLAVRHSFQTAVLAALVLAVGSFATIAAQMRLRAREAAAEQHKSEQALAERDMGLVEFNRQSWDFLYTQKLGWFLTEWHEGRLDRARAIRDGVPKDTVWYALMSFLLDDAYDGQRFLDDLPIKDKSLGCFVVAERYRKAGRTADAIKFYELSLQSPVSDWMRSAAEARLAALRDRAGGREEAALRSPR